MAEITASIPHDTCSLSRRYFTCIKKIIEGDVEDDDMEDVLNFSCHSSKSDEKERQKPEGLKNQPMQQEQKHSVSTVPVRPPRRKLSVMAVAKFRSVIGRALAGANLSNNRLTKVVGTLFGHRGGHVHFSIQDNFKQTPAFLVELATPTSILVKETASGFVRIVLECDKKTAKKGLKLLEEPIWRTYCNGKNCGYAMRRECGEAEWKVLNAIGQISMGAGVLPGAGETDGELMHMRATFQRVAGSKDSETFYMMNPDENGGSELSIYLLRV